MISKQMVAWGESGCSIREIAAYGERRAAEIGPENVYNFAIGNPSIDPPDCVQEAVERLLHTVPPTQLHAYAPAPGPDAWRRKLEDPNAYVRRHARLMLDEIARDGGLRTVEPAALHVLRVGQFPIVAIGGEVVVDYALAIKRKYGDATWVAGYTDAVYGYLPSVRVLREGGYEGGDAMLYFGRPGPFADTVESTVLAGVDALMARTSAG